MPPFIALELILCILRHLPSYLLHDLNNCALVCRSWAPHARSFAFRAIRLSSAEHTIELIDLLTSPHETISAAIKYINIEGWFGDHVFSSLGSSRAIKPDAGKILKAFTTASERSLSFPHVKRLNLEKIEWGSVSPSVRKAFMDHNPFQSLVWLRLSSCSFETYAQYWELIHSFPLLESYDHGDCIYIPFKSVDCVTSPKPLRLRALHWHVTYVPRAMEAWPDAAVFNALLLESGESLEELEFIVEQCIPDESESHLFPVFDFTRTTRLRKLHMKFKSTSWAFILAFLRNMTQARSNTLQNLSLSCRIPQSGPSQDIDSYYQIPVDLAAMDTVLRHPFFSSLQRIAFGNFFCSFSESDVTNQRLAGKTRFERPDDDSVPGKRLNRAIERLKASFEGSGKAGIVVPVAVEYYRSPFKRYASVYDLDSASHELQQDGYFGYRNRGRSSIEGSSLRRSHSWTGHRSRSRSCYGTLTRSTSRSSCGDTSWQSGASSVKKGCNLFAAFRWLFDSAFCLGSSRHDGLVNSE